VNVEHHRTMDAPPEREETERETGLHYRSDQPVCVTIVRRRRRLFVNDRGAALRHAGMPPGWRTVASRIERELDVNVTRRGVVWLPVVTAGPGLEEIVGRIAEASLALYQDVLELER